MGMTHAYGPGDEESGLQTIHRALELGVTFLDTAEIYGPHTNERLVGRAIAGRRDEVAARHEVRLRGSTPTTRGRVASTVARRTSAVPSRGRSSAWAPTTSTSTTSTAIDPDVPIEETVGAMAELVQAGKVRYIGLSEAAPETIRRAHATHPLTAIQMRVLAVDA